MLITGYSSILPERVAEAINNLSEDLNTLTEVKKYVRRQVLKHTKVKADGKAVLEMEREGEEEKSTEENEEEGWGNDEVGSMVKGGWN